MKRGSGIVFLFFIFAAIFLFSSVLASALMTSIVKEYSPAQEKIILKNGSLGSAIAEVTLKTPRHNYVGVGQPIAEIELNSYEDYKNFISGFRVINLRTGREVNKNVEIRGVESVVYKIAVTNYSGVRYQLDNGTFVYKTTPYLEERVNKSYYPLENNGADVKKGKK